MISATRSGVYARTESRSSSNPVRVPIDVLAIDEVVLDDDVNEAVEQRQVRPWPDGQVQVGHHRRLGDARIDDDQRRAGIGLEPPAQNRVIVGDVRADEHDHVGDLEVLVRSRAARRCRTMRL